jgi:hypothetical protein
MKNRIQIGPIWYEIKKVDRAGLLYLGGGPMKIRLLCDLPVREEHGMTQERVFEVVHHSLGAIFHPRWYVVGSAGEEVGVMPLDAEIVHEEE